jgi:hypothetical protein
MIGDAGLRILIDDSPQAHADTGADDLVGKDAAIDRIAFIEIMMA